MIDFGIFSLAYSQKHYISSYLQPLKGLLAQIIKSHIYAVYLNSFKISIRFNHLFDMRTDLM